jgi:MFS family permease
VSWRDLAIDLRPLRSSRDFRLLFTGRAVSFLGARVTDIALPVQMWHLTHSSLAVGMLALCELVPLLTISLVGGVIADTHDRRRTFQRTELGLGAVSMLLAGNALLPHPHASVLYALAAVAGGLSAIGVPSLTAMIPRLVEPDQLPAASALNGLYGSAGMIVGPLLGGVLIAVLGYSGTYLVDVASFGVGFACLARMRAVPPPEGAPGGGLRSMREGFAFLARDQVIQGTYIVDFVAMVFGMPMALFPALAATRFHGGPRMVGVMFAAPAIGSLLATTTSGWTRGVHRYGVAITAAAGVWGVGIVGFGVAHSFPVAVAFLAVAGGADMVSGIFRMATWNRRIPDALRGRLAALEWANVNSGPLLGNVEAGAVAAWRGPAFSVLSGGIVCIAATVVAALTLPRFLAYDAREPVA